MPNPLILERIKMAEKHLRLAINWKGEKLGVLETRRHYSSYFRGLPNFKKYKTKMVTSDHSAQLFELFQELKISFKRRELVC